MTSNGMTRVVAEPTAAGAAPRNDDDRDSDAKTDATPQSKPTPVDAAPAPETPPTTEAAPVTEAASATEANSTPVETPIEAGATAGAAPVETPPAAEAPLRTEPTPAAEAAPALPLEPSTEPAATVAEKPATSDANTLPAPVSVPPAPLESRAAPYSTIAPAIEVSEEWRPRTTFWNTRPNRTWMLVGGSAVVIAFLLGTVTGRVTGPERSAEYIAPASPAAVPVATTEPALVTAAPALPSNASPRDENVPRTASAPLKSSPKALTNEAPVAKQGAPAFNAKAAKAAIDGVSPRLKACKHSGDPVGPASVMVTFAPAGRVSNAAITTTGYTGTRTGNCVIARLRELRIPEFTGAAVTVKRSVTVR